MSSTVLDSSVLLAILRDENSTVDLVPLVQGAIVSTVNLAEVLAKLDDLSPASKPRAEALFLLLGKIEPLTEAQARAVATLRGSTRHRGLSLGDRACLALAIERDADVYTADRAWKDLNLPCRIHIVR